MQVLESVQEEPMLSEVTKTHELYTQPFEEEVESEMAMSPQVYESTALALISLVQ